MIKDVEPLLKECEETLKELKEMGNFEVACYVQGFINSINKLPDAEQRSHGEWENCGGILCARCSVCKEVAYETAGNFCSNCGADMRTKEGEPEKSGPCMTCGCVDDITGCCLVDHYCEEYINWKEGESNG